MKMGDVIVNFARDGIRMPSRIAGWSAQVSSQIEQLKILTAKMLINQMGSHGPYNNIHDTEFSVFSQFGDDGIIQYLINNIEVKERTFIEFGVQNYTEANTRFLLINNNWTGLVLDSCLSNIEYIKNDNIYWKYELNAIHSFITMDNINQSIIDNVLTEEIGLLSIDIDGNDYWIWDCIDAVSPTIVVIEYNSIFGYKAAITVPYDPLFNRTKAHYSNQFWGCSLKALYLLAERKGYVFVGCNNNGNNAYFVRKDRIGALKSVSLMEGYVKSKFRDSRDMEGRLSFVSGDKRLDAIAEMYVYDIEKSSLIRIKDI